VALQRERQHPPRSTGGWVGPWCLTSSRSSGWSAPQARPVVRRESPIAADEHPIAVQGW